MTMHAMPVVRLDGGEVELERDVKVTMRDGARISCDIYRPSQGGRHPAVLEQLPYRKDDLRAAQDRAQCVELARRGVVCVRADVRGTGSSDGVAADEYTEAEQEDACELVAWMAAQPWSTGRVGAWGVSYAGFGALQLAARRPPALHAIAAVHASDDRYTDDCHYVGGVLSALELARYPIRMLALNALPPLGEPSDALLAEWRRRIEATPPWVLRWIEEQEDGPYWRVGSVRAAYDRIACPVFLVAGWRDGYRTAMIRLARELRAPWRLVVGPWGHALPDRGAPGPRYPFLAELARWMHAHLGETRVPAPEPDATRSIVYLAEHQGRTDRAHTPGRWIATGAWPEPRATAAETMLHASARGTLETAEASGPEPFSSEVISSATVGLAAGKWSPPAGADALPTDQREDEAGSVTWTSAPLAAPVVLLGVARVRGRAHAAGDAVLAIKVADVAPDGEGGASELVTRALVRLTATRGDRDLDVELAPAGWTFRAGHRIRVALATSDWPTAWPRPRKHAVHVTALRLALPGLPEDAADFTPTEASAAIDDEHGIWARLPQPMWEITGDETGALGVRGEDGITLRHPDERLVATETRRYSAFARDGDPPWCRVDGEVEAVLVRDVLEARVHARARYESGATPGELVVDIVLDVHHGDERIAHRRWQRIYKPR